VRGYELLLMAMTRNSRLRAAGARAVSRTVWLRLVEHRRNLSPRARPGWIASTTEHECGRYIRLGRRVVLVDPQAEAAPQRQAVPDPKGDVLRSELRQSLRDEISEQPARDWGLLRLRTADPPKSNQEISNLMAMPVSRIGPMVGRCLELLRPSTAPRTYPVADPGRGRRPRRRSA
jgi:DNA-directed RNA polymerase specialized sigma24 family protein